MSKIELINNNLINSFKLLGLKQENVPVEHYILNTGCKSPLMNLICLPTAASNDNIITMEYNLKKQNLPYAWWIDEKFLNQPLSSHFAQHNFNFFGNVPGMILNLNKDHSISPPEHSNLTIKQIFTEAEFNIWIDVLATNFGFTKDVQKLYKTTFLPYLMNSENIIFFGAYIDKQIVGTASIFIHDDVAGFYNDSTLENYRHKGIASALYNARIDYVRKVNIKNIVIQSSPAATSIAKKFGFEEVINYKIYIHS